MPRQVCEWIAKFTVFLYLNLRSNLEPTLLPPLEVFSRVAWLYRHRHPVEFTLSAYESMLGQKIIKNIVAGLRQNISDSSRQIFLLDPTPIDMLRNDLSNGTNEKIVPSGLGIQYLSLVGKLLGHRQTDSIWRTPNWSSSKIYAVDSSSCQPYSTHLYVHFRLDTVHRSRPDAWGFVCLHGKQYSLD